MGTFVTCNKCNNSDRYSSYEIRNVGTFAHPIWSVSCHFCNSLIKNESDPSDFPKNSDLIFDRDKETSGILISKKGNVPQVNDKGNAFERAENSDIREYWIQLYFKEFYQEFGFNNIEGPFDIGPDFTTTQHKKIIGVEIERDWQSYINHKHHLSDSFKNVEYLIVLNPNKPTDDKIKLLPTNILFIEIEKFVPWFKIKCKEYSEKKTKENKEQQLPLLFELIKGEFQKRYIQNCQDKNREMATCPFCNNCAYEPEYDFMEFAIEFIVKYEHPIYNEDFSLGSINPQHLDYFFNEKMNN
jgi:hypothetical protein